MCKFIRKLNFPLSLPCFSSSNTRHIKYMRNTKREEHTYRSKLSTSSPSSHPPPSDRSHIECSHLLCDMLVSTGCEIFTSAGLHTGAPQTEYQIKAHCDPYYANLFIHPASALNGSWKQLKAFAKPSPIIIIIIT